MDIKIFLQRTSLQRLSLNYCHLLTRRNHNCAISSTVATSYLKTDHNESLVCRRHLLSQVFGFNRFQRNFSEGANQLQEEPKLATTSTTFSNVVILRGLPWRCKVEDIVSFFEGCDIARDGICITLNRDGRSTGQAFVEFVSEEAAGIALSKHKQLIGRRYVEIYPSNKEAMQRAEQETRMYRENTLDEMSTGRGNLVMMRGLPFRARDKDIADFFHPLELARITINQTFNGLPDGTARVQFRSPEDSAQAMKRHRQLMGQRYIELKRFVDYRQRDSD